MKNTIPNMTHPLSSKWHQPDTKNIIIDDIHALMDEESFKKLHDYSHSQPTGVYEGKMWKSYFNNKWYLRWYDEHKESNLCSNRYREILIA